MRPFVSLAVALGVLLASACRREGGPVSVTGPVPAPITAADAGPVGEPPPPGSSAPAVVPRAAADAHPAAAPASPASAPADAPDTAVTPAAPKAERLELTFVGDIIFGRYRDVGFVPLAADPSFDPLAEIRATLAADVVVGNLETPVVETLPAASPITTRHRFGASRQLVRDHLRDFTILGLANNHSFDLVEDGQRQSPRILAEEGIMPIGAARTEAPLHRVETHATRGWRIAFIAVTTLVNIAIRPDTPQVPFVEVADMPATLLPLVEAARADHDLVVVFVHWGTEYYAAPSRLQQKVARRLVDGGVDMVIGHHPHVLQAIERHGDGLIAYSLGNFLFSHTTSAPRLLGVLRTAWQAAPEGAAPEGSTLVDAVLHPAINEGTPYPHPAPATGERAEEVRERIVGLSRHMGTRWTRVVGTEDLRLAPSRRAASTDSGRGSPPP